MYWQAPPLPLPKSSKLYWTNGVFDQAVAWFLSHRGNFHRKKPGLSPIISDQELLTLTLVKNPVPSYSKKSYNANDHIFLPQRRVGSILLVDCGTPKDAYAFSTEENQHAMYLVFLRKGKGWVLYPRSLRNPEWSSKMSVCLRDTTLQELEPKWLAIMHALPEYALTVYDRMRGLPHLLASTPMDSYSYNADYGWWCTEKHSYWKHARHALLAAAAIRRLSFPPPNDSVCPSFHWTIRVPEVKTHNHSPFPLTIKFGWDGWHHEYDDKEPRKTPPHVLDNFKGVHKALATVLERHAPDIPFFFDRVGESLGHYNNHPGSYTPYTASHIFPWIKNGEDVIMTRTAHDALHWLNKIPPEWGRDLVALLDSSLL